VVDVASTGNLVNAPSANCAAARVGTPAAPNATCKPTAAHPDLRHDVRRLVARLEASAVDPGRNLTPPLSATDTSPGDLSGVACASGFCHLAGAPVSNHDAYGAGLLSLARP
jgi:hypothetical protein